jgi:hypothetical protein
LRLAFDREMVQLRAVTMQIEQLLFHARAEESYMRVVSGILAGGGIIL